MKSEAGFDLVLIETSLLFFSKILLIGASGGTFPAGPAATDIFDKLVGWMVC